MKSAIRWLPQTTFGLHAAASDDSAAIFLTKAKVILLCRFLTRGIVFSAKRRLFAGRLCNTGTFGSGSNSIMRTTEFRFRAWGCGDEAVRYSVIVVDGISVTFIRIRSTMKPFFLLVPRGSDKGIADADAEDLARMAIAQSLRDGLLEAHPEGALDLTAVGLRWDGDLTDGQWLHD